MEAQSVEGMQLHISVRATVNEARRAEKYAMQE